ncbi:hypothetical protein CRYUN_Cryun38cG0019800 [Craigia yunnanensis]
MHGFLLSRANLLCLTSPGFPLDVPCVTISLALAVTPAVLVAARSLLSPTPTRKDAPDSSRLQHAYVAQAASQFLQVTSQPPVGLHPTCQPVRLEPMHPCQGHPCSPSPLAYPFSASATTTATVYHQQEASPLTPISSPFFLPCTSSLTATLPLVHTQAPACPYPYNPATCPHVQCAPVPAAAPFSFNVPSQLADASCQLSPY